MSEEKIAGAAGVCPVCGLPKDLCVCSAIAQETQRIVISAAKRRYGKIATVIAGVDAKETKNVARVLKEKLACGGTVRDSEIELQGDHRQKVKSILVSMGYQPDSIDIVAAIKG